MLQKDVRVGDHYVANVSGAKTVVRLDSVRDITFVSPVRKQWNVTNLRTGRRTSFRSTAKFQRRATDQEVANARAAAMTRRPSDRGPYPEADAVGRGAVRLGRAGRVDEAETLLRNDDLGKLIAAANPDPEGEQRPDPRSASSLPNTALSVNARLAARAATPARAPDRSPHLIVEARAGTGKTTTLVSALQRLKGIEPRAGNGAPMVPSDQQAAVWDAVCRTPRDASVTFVAFNKSIATELQRRVPAGCAASTMHSLGFAACRKALGKLEPTEWVVPDLIAELMGTNPRDLRKNNPVVLQTTARLVGLCKMNLVGTEYTAGANGWETDLDALTSHYDVDLDRHRRTVFDLVPRVLDRCRDPKGRIDFDDMIYLPVALNLPIPKADLLLVDECLPGNTPIMLADGSSKRIKEIVESEREFIVRALNTHTGEPMNCRVLAKQKIRNTKLSVRISVRHQSKVDGVAFSKRSFVVCTVDHKIWTINRGWVPAGEITTTDTLILETDAHVSQEGKNPSEHRQAASVRQTGDACTLRGHTGGNGRGFSKAERVLLTALRRVSTDWEGHVVLPTGQGALSRGLPKNYKLDIANQAMKVCVEVDGTSHYGRRNQDARKEEYLESLGWTVIRTTNSRAINQTDAVVCQITGNCPKPARVVSVKPINIPDPYVYDITVEDCHNFYANGILVHNCQDLNRCQQTLAKMAGHRLVFCGDEAQAIYGFSGADSESIPRLRSELTATDVGIERLPLTVTRRCGKAIVEEARRWVPDFEAHPDNPEGAITEARYPTRKKADGTTEAVPWEQTYGPRVRPGDMVTCRTNAPLVTQCFAFIRRGVKANIQGRDVGKGLVALVRKMTGPDEAMPVPELVGRLDDWLAKETATEEARRNPSATRLQGLADRHGCLVAFAEGAGNAADVLGKIDAVFTDDKHAPGVRFSSIHRAKGLEADRVFGLRPPDGGFAVPMQEWERQQEENLRYVEVTRAINEFCVVS